MPIYSNMPEDFYPRPSDVNAPLRSTIGIGPRGPKGHSITAEIIDNDPYGYFRVQFKDVETGEVLVTTPNLDVGSRFFVYSRHLEDVVEGDTETVNNYDFTSLQASSDRSAIRVGDLVLFTTSMTDETFLAVDTVGIGVVNSVNGTQVSFVVTNVMNAQLRDGAITTDMLANLCVTTAKIDNDAVTNDKIADNAVNTDQIATSAVTTDKINNSAVTTAKIADEAVTNEKIGSNAVNNNKIADGSVSTTKIENLAVTTAKIAQNAVTHEKISDNAVSKQNMMDGAIGTSEMEDNAVTTNKIANSSITTLKIADNSITDAKLAQEGNVLSRVEEVHRLFDYGRESENLFDERLVVDGAFVTPQGSTTSNSSWCYIRINNVHPSEKYSLSGARHMTCYVGSTIVPGGADSNEDEVVTIPADANTMIVSVLIDYKKIFAIARSNSIIPYTEFMANPEGNLNIYNKDEVDALIYNQVTSNATVVHGATYQAQLPDANNANRNTIYRFIGFTEGTNLIPQNLPFSTWPQDSSYEALMIDSSDSVSSLYREQFFIISKKVYSRSYDSSNSRWNTWHTLISTSNALETNSTVVHGATYQAQLPDANNANKNTVYRFIGFTIGTNLIPQNLPFSTWPQDSSYEALMIDSSDPVSNLYREQFLIMQGKVYSRSYDSSSSRWNVWHTLISENVVYNVDVNHPGIRDYTSLTKAIIDNFGKSNVTIIVWPGTYDIISEIEDIYGEGYLETISERWFGCTFLGNGIHIIFAEDAEIVCNYTGDNSWIRYYFSPFNAAAGGFTLENMNIVCSGVRYCVHDERSQDGEVYRNYYLNCQMYKDSDNGTIQEQCIGGGLGKNGQIIIRDCYFSGDKSTAQILVSYHNSSSGEARSKIIVNSNYFDKKGKVRFSHYGPNTKKTKCLVSNNSFGDSIEISYESQDYSVENMEVIEWNNIVRT